MQQRDEFAEAIEIIKGRYYFVALKQTDAVQRSSLAATHISYCIDSELLYEPFYADFGPLNLGRTYRFCELTKRLLQEAEQRGKRLYLYTGPQVTLKANATVLVGIFQVLYLDRSADEAYAPLSVLKPFQPFRDASCGVSTFHLTVLDCIRGISKGREVGFLDAQNGTWTFDIEEYEHYEQVENGDLNWILPGKLLAFSGPAVRSTDYVGFRAMVPEDYWEYYRKTGITAIVRLNKKVYDRKRFLDGGFRHHELYFPDGSCPTEPILRRFLEIAEAEPGALAIHCKAGLGRTGVLICSYLMKHYRFTAEEVIGYIRVCRPGSVIGPQQNFVKEIQALMWHEGEVYRAANGPVPPMPVWGPARAAATAAATAAAASGMAAKVGAVYRIGRSSSVSSAVGMKPGAARRVTREGAADGSGGLLAARGASAGSMRPPQGAIQSQGGTSAGGAGALSKSITDLSLTQLQERLHNVGIGGRASSASAAAGGSGQAGTGIAQSYGLNSSISSGGGMNIRPASNSAGAAAAAARATTPTRQTSSSSNKGPLTTGLLAGRPSSQQLLARLSSGGNHGSHMLYGSGSSSAHEQALNALLGGGAGSSNSNGSLRATLHTDTISAANRPKVESAGAISQSSDFISAGWKSGGAGGAAGAAGMISTTNGSATAAGGVGLGSSMRSAVQSKVARILAPNGQPRKVPAAALLAANDPSRPGGGAGALGAYY